MHGVANFPTSAIGTPLEWPEAKKVASHVRSWGIEVGFQPGDASSCGGFLVTLSCSNCSPYGGMQRGKRGMRCCGATRYVFDVPYWKRRRKESEYGSRRSYELIGDHRSSISS
jgi:hypothetical protein